MSTIRVAKKKEFPYIQIDKFAIDEDNRISWQAKGLLTYLIGKPDDWTIRIKDLTNRASNGRDAVFGIINELIAAGYIERERVRSEDSKRAGQFEGINYIVYETPLHTEKFEKKKTGKKTKDSPHPENPDMVKEGEKSPRPENPDTVKPDTENPDPVIPTYSNNESSNNDFSNDEEEDIKDTPPAISARFIEKDIQRIQKLYPQYSKVVEDMGAAAIRDRRPVFGEEEIFLEQAAAIPVHPETLWEVYTSVRSELDRTSGNDYAPELIEEVFAKFGRGLKKQRITIDAASWFKSTWTNEKISLEQAAMIK
ncbi:hypothetical protein [Paenibacillus sp. 1P03SA]|uniref:hypothetical protein n=1 Tax=Paenibacillus sp. 1P03SA TaxID=3132294 RepID=UPI0039A0591B